MDLKFLNEYKDKINKSKDIIKKVWNFDRVPYTPTIAYLDPCYNLNQKKIIDRDKYLLNKEVSLEIKINSIKEHLKNINDEFIPYIDTFMGTPIISSTFGGEIRFFKDKDPWLIGSVINDYRDIDRIKEPDPSKTGLTKVTLDCVDYWKLKVNEKIPISMPDIQGPLSVGIDLMGANKFYLCLFDDPKRTHKLLEIITGVIINFIKTLLSKIEESDGLYEWTGIFFPKNKGRVRISEDNLISISEEVYKEFSQPYNESILKEIGGGIIHWCGNGHNNFENVISTKLLTGVHNSSMGDLSLIESQIKRLNYLKDNNDRKIIYFNSMLLPTSKRHVKDILKSLKPYNGFINHIFAPPDNYGVTFDPERTKQGYGSFVDKPIEILNEFFRDKNFPKK